MDNFTNSIDPQPSLFSLPDRLTFGRLSVNYTDSQLWNAVRVTSSSHVGSFEGCLERIRVNSVDLSPDLLEGGESLPEELSLRYHHVPWGNLSIGVRGITLDEGSNITLSDLSIHVQYPDSFRGFHGAYWYQRDVESSVVFEVVRGPNYGYFVRGDSNYAINSFLYDDIRTEQVTKFNFGEVHGLYIQTYVFFPQILANR